MIHFITKAKQTEKDLRTRFADDKFAEWEAQVIDALDVDFSLVRREVHTMEEFEQQLKAPFLENKEKIFYRGERVDDRARPLIPTIFRNRQALFDNGDAVAKVTADFVYDFYSRDGSYMHLYEKAKSVSAVCFFPALSGCVTLCGFYQESVCFSVFCAEEPTGLSGAVGALYGKNSGRRGLYRVLSYG